MVTRTAGRPLGALGRMSLVAAIHAAVLLAIMRSLGMGSAPAETPRLIGEFFPEKATPEELEPPRNPEFLPSQTRLVVPQPDVDHMSFEVDTPTEAMPQGEFGEETTGSAVVQPEIVGVRHDPRYPLTRPPYSARMIREGNQGAIDLEVYVLPNGRVGDARVVKSTGFEELDLAALAEAKRHWRLLPAMRDGVAIAQWHRLRVTFKLNQQR